MKRSLVLLLAPVLAVGCRNSPQTMDPFPRTTVPPPSTGAAIGAPAPYYPGAATGAAPMTAPASPYTPPGGSYNYPAGDAPLGAPGGPPASPQPMDRFPMSQRNEGTKQSKNTAPRELSPKTIQSSLALQSGAKRDPAVKPASAEADAGPVSAPPKTSNEVKIVRVATTSTPRETAAAPASATDSVSAQEPRRLPPENEPVDIMDLPPAHLRGTALQASRRVALAADQEAGSSGASTAGPDAPSAPDRYAYAPDYGWLKGQLEYSLVDRRWKLRYIPIDGDTDSHGGSVVLEGEIPSEFQPGDFVAVRGSLAGDASPGQFAPGYQFNSMAPLAD